MLQSMWLREIVPGIVADLLRRRAVRRGLEHFVDRSLDGDGDSALHSRRPALVVHDLVDMACRDAEITRDATDRFPASH
jgi:hypothetical protein